LGHGDLQREGTCILCHHGPTFTDNKFYSLGVPQVGPLKVDWRRYAVTRLESTTARSKPRRWAASRTRLRTWTTVFATIEDVIDFLDKGGEPVKVTMPKLPRRPTAQEDQADQLPYLPGFGGFSAEGFSTEGIAGVGLSARGFSTLRTVTSNVRFLPAKG
jgi:hypothetical protein